MKTREILKQIDDVKEELRQMALNEISAREALQRLSDDDKIDDAEREQRGMTFSFRLTSIPLRRAKLEKDLGKLNGALAAAFNNESSAVVRRLKAERDAKYNELCAALAPFYNAAPDSRAVRRVVDSLHVPALQEFYRLSTKVDLR